ncbi:MAG TPA: OB-fold domain-containing protein [Trebonia sp.]|jgi:hypothetical protein|nr:OB-fold domain-containing protein [Trebonia sp.]
MKVIPANHEKPAPTISAYNKPFWDSARAHELRMQRCDKCGKFWAPAGPVCPFCFSGEFTWEQASGLGVIASLVVFHKSYHPEFDNDMPLAAALVQLAEGPRLITNIVQADGAPLASGMPVEVVFEDHVEFTLPQFCPVTDAGPTRPPTAQDSRP